MKLRDVRYLTEDQRKEWAKFLDNQTDSLESMKENIEDWHGLVDDVEDLIEKWSPQDFEKFKKCLKMERKGIFYGQENATKYAPIIMPELMFKASIIADQFTAPWGAAIIRLIEHDEKFQHLKNELLK